LRSSQVFMHVGTANSQDPVCNLIVGQLQEVREN
jgi:hypothetical protein